jgi:hypothetical protein
MTYLFTHFDHLIEREKSNYNQFAFRGKQQSVGSLFATWNYHNLLLFGESAFSSNGGQAHIVGLNASLTRYIEFATLYRNFSPEFHSFYGNSFGENSTPINEKGMYWGLKITPASKHQFTVYYDRFEFPWLSFQANAPSKGHEYLGRYTYTLRNHTSLYLQFREEKKQLSTTHESGILSQLTTPRKRNFWFNIDYNAGNHIEMKSRVQFSTYDLLENLTSGIAIIQDVNVTLDRFKIGGRLALFDTDYENRQYVYEKDVRFAFAIPAYQGQGTRSYVLIQYAANHRITFWVKYGRYNFENAEIVGSGNEATKGSVRSDIRFQSLVSF